MTRRNIKYVVSPSKHSDVRMFYWKRNNNKSFMFIYQAEFCVFVSLNVVIKSDRRSRLWRSGYYLLETKNVDQEGIRFK